MADFFSLPEGKRGKVISLFQKNFVRGRPNECWIWEGSVTSHGYGRIQPVYRGLKFDFKAHRLAWILEYNSSIPAGLLVCHSCDTPRCVNPKHLMLATPQHNMTDCVLKDRRKLFKKAKRIEIVRKVVSGKFLREVAEEYNMGVQTVYLYTRSQEAREIFGEIDLSPRWGGSRAVKIG